MPSGFYIDTSTTSSLVWPQWVTASNYTITGTSTATWDAWNDDTGTTSATTWRQWTWPSQQRVTTAHQETVEQREARAREEAERQRIWDAGEPERAAARERARQAELARAAKRAGAHRRAMELLYLVLSVDQKKMLEEKKFFHVDAVSGRRYRIDQGNHANVKVVDKATGNILETLCVQPDGLPDGDVMLIQKLLIETAEQAFRDTANISEWGSYRLISRSQHLLTGEKLAEILRFPQGGRIEEVSAQVQAA